MGRQLYIDLDISGVFTTPLEEQIRPQSQAALPALLGELFGEWPSVMCFPFRDEAWLRYLWWDPLDLVVLAQN